MKSKIQIFGHHFLNVKISAIIKDKHLTFSVLIFDVIKELTVSQIFDM